MALLVRKLVLFAKFKNICCRLLRPSAVPETRQECSFSSQPQVNPGIILLLSWSNSSPVLPFGPQLWVPFVLALRIWGDILACIELSMQHSTSEFPCDVLCSSSPFWPRERPFLRSCGPGGGTHCGSVDWSEGVKSTSFFSGTIEEYGDCSFTSFYFPSHREEAAWVEVQSKTLHFMYGMVESIPL